MLAFSGLVPAMFLDGEGRECANGDPQCGLYIRSREVCCSVSSSFVPMSVRVCVSEWVRPSVLFEFLASTTLASGFPKKTNRSQLKIVLLNAVQIDGQIDRLTYPRTPRYYTHVLSVFIPSEGPFPLFQRPISESLGASRPPSVVGCCSSLSLVCRSVWSFVFSSSLRRSYLVSGIFLLGFCSFSLSLVIFGFAVFRSACWKIAVAPLFRGHWLESACRPGSRRPPACCSRSARRHKCSPAEPSRPRLTLSERRLRKVGGREASER